MGPHCSSLPPRFASTSPFSTIICFAQCQRLPLGDPNGLRGNRAHTFVHPNGAFQNDDLRFSPCPPCLSRVHPLGLGVGGGRKGERGPEKQQFHHITYTTTPPLPPQHTGQEKSGVKRRIVEAHPRHCGAKRLGFELNRARFLIRRSEIHDPCRATWQVE